MSRHLMMTGKLSLLIACILLVVLVVTESRRPQLLIVGNLTVDVVDGKRALGGAISYAAAVASAYGVRACIVTAGGQDADYSGFTAHELHVVPTAATLTFEHTYTWWGNNRKLKVVAQPNVTLTAAHVPKHCRGARTVLLGPLMPQDMDCASFIQPAGLWDRLTGFHQRIGLMAQGLQRGLDAAGRVVTFKAPSADLTAALGPSVSVFLSDVETDPWPTGSIDALTQRTARLLVTRGEHGAREMTASGTAILPAEKVVAVDTNGAGDTFATAYMLALSRHDRSPGMTANWAAARAVSQPQTCKPGCVETGIKASLPWGRVNSWFSDQMQHLHSALPDAVHGACWRFQGALDVSALYIQQAKSSSTEFLAQNIRFLLRKEQATA